MKPQVKNPAPPRARLAALVSIVLSGMGGQAFAALTDIAPAPLSTASTVVVKPNVNFVLDTSGSMAWSHAPDDVDNFTANYGYVAAQCNSMYYSPTIIYRVPKNPDGTDFAAATFNNAKDDGFDTSSPSTTDLRDDFRAFTNTTSNGNGSDGNQAAYYYKYKGTNVDADGAPVVNFQNSNSSFYKECNSKFGDAPGKDVFTKVTVSATSGPGGTDERQNFANWYSYYRTRILTMKSGAGRAFSSVGVSYRVGFMTIYATPSTSTTDAEYLKISDFDKAQKEAWYKKVYATSPGGGTPLRTALSTAGRNYAGKVGPDPVQYACQPNFLILTTDGYWNAGSDPPVELDGTTAIKNTDGVRGTKWPDPPTAATANTSPPPLWEGKDNATSGTLADAAFYYYKTDLRTGNAAQCATGVAGADVCDNIVRGSDTDKADWQHMTTFTLGLGVNGKLLYTNDYATDPVSDFAAISKGDISWPKPVGDTLTAIDDLWHAAVNGHGQYFSAKTPDLLVSGLVKALDKVKAAEGAGAAAATSNLEPTNVDNFAYIANYETVSWTGDVQGRTIDVATGVLSTTSLWSAQDQLDTRVSDAADTRRIFTINASGVGSREFIPGNFSNAEKLAWFAPTAGTVLTQSGSWTPAQTAAATADSLINYLRGQDGFEMDGKTSKPIQLYRDRTHVLGDIIDGKPVFVRTPPFNYTENNYDAFKATNATRQGVVYVAANDGMLHAFNADTGAEMWGYVPSFVLPKMKALADTNYSANHQFLVDGSPTISDVWTGTAWKTILIAGLNGGGKGYYALDITLPAAPVILWEFKDANVGFTYGNPVVGKMTDGTWITAFTSGYNNADGVGRLYVLDAYTGVQKSFSPISTATGTATSPSGLGRISAWTDNGLVDNTILRIYGGDMLGNLWRFDINNTIAPAGRDAMKLATLQAGSVIQPITTKPELGLVENVPVVFVGTGRYLGTTDLTDFGQQTLYAIKDTLTATGVGNPRTSSSCGGLSQSFVQQEIKSQDANTRVAVEPAKPVNFSSDCGWWVDFNPLNATPGERINVDLKLQLGVLGVITNIPEASVCKSGGSSFIYFFNYATGGAVNSFVEITDVNGVPSTVTISKVGERVGNATAVGMNTYRLKDGRVITTVTTSDDKHPVYGNPVYTGGAGSARRVLWRELLN